MKKIKFMALMLACLTALVTFTACGDDDDDEPVYDPAKPYIGSWVIDDVYNWDWRSYIGGLLLDEEQARQDFIDKWEGKTLKFTSKTKVEDDKIIYTENVYTDETRTEWFEIRSTSEDAMTLYYVYECRSERLGLEQRTTATMELHRK